MVEDSLNTLECEHVYGNYTAVEDGYKYVCKNCGEEVFIKKVDSIDDVDFSDFKILRYPTSAKMWGSIKLKTAGPNTIFDIEEKEFELGDVLIFYPSYDLSTRDGLVSGAGIDLGRSTSTSKGYLNLNAATPPRIISNLHFFDFDTDCKHLNEEVREDGIYCSSCNEKLCDLDSRATNPYNLDDLVISDIAVSGRGSLRKVVGTVTYKDQTYNISHTLRNLGLDVDSVYSWSDTYMYVDGCPIGVRYINKGYDIYIFNLKYQVITYTPLEVIYMNL